MYVFYIQKDTAFPLKIVSGILTICFSVNSFLFSIEVSIDILIVLH